MTTDQAIKILEGAIKKPNTIDGYLGQALTMAINALKKQIPKPFIWKDGNPICPECEEEVWDMEWCNSCGQRLDRDVEECDSDEK